MKRVLCLFLACMLLLPLGTQAAVIGTGYATDIKAYVDCLMVPSYNIDGNTVVIVRDLENFGYTVNWDESARVVRFYRDFAKPVTPTIPTYNGTPVGTKVFDVYETDIRVFFKEKEIPAYNIGGRTAVRLRDIALVGEAVYDPTYKSAEIFSFETVYFDDEIAYIKTNFYGRLLLLSQGDQALQPLVSMVESGVYNAKVVEDYKAFYNSMREQFAAYKAYKEPYGFDKSAMELWWAMVNMQLAGETMLIMAETLRCGGNAMAAMNDYNQYRIDDLEQRRVALLTLYDDIMQLTFFWE